MAMTIFRVRFWALASLLLLLLAPATAPATALACDTGGDSSAPAAKTKKR
jgi:hypothetical protein